MHFRSVGEWTENCREMKTAKKGVFGMTGYGCPDSTRELLCSLLLLSATVQVSTAQSCPAGCTECGPVRVDCRSAGLTSFPQLPPDVQGSVEIFLAERNRIGLLEANVLENYTSLRRLDLVLNELTQLPEGLFDNTTQLQELDLHNNKLTQLPEGLFGATTQLQQLSLYENRLTQLPEGLFRATTQLQSLDLDTNQLTEIPEGLFSTTTLLHELRLWNNKLTQLPDNLFYATTQLQRLDIGCNQLTELPEGLLNATTQFRTLFLDDNQLTQLPEALFNATTQLQEVRITHNKLKQLPEGLLDVTTQLHTLDLGNNQLTEVPEGLFDATTQLQELFLNNNQLTQLPEGLLSATTQLYTLFLDNNLLTQFPEGLLSATTQLHALRLNNNQLTEIPEGLFNATTQLQELFLDNNQLTQLPEGLLSATTQLQTLRLNDNQLTEIPEGLFNATTQLHTLCLQNNQLTQLPEGLFIPEGLSNAATQLQTLKLSGNPLYCVCNLSWLPDFLRNVTSSTEESATCATPAHLSGVSVVSLTVDQFVCDTFSLMSSGDAFEDNGTWILSILIPKQVILEFDVDIDVQIDLGPDGVEPQFTTVSFPAGSEGPLTLEIQYSVPPDDTVEPDENFTVVATIQRPEIALFRVGPEWQSTDSVVFTILNDDDTVQPPAKSGDSSSELAARVAGGVTGGLLAILILLIVIILWVWRKRNNRLTARPVRRGQYPHYSNPYTTFMEDRKGSMIASSEHMEKLTAEMIIPSTQLKLFNTIGQGEFGIVCRGQILDKRRLSEVAGTGVEAFAGMVAVKTLKGFYDQTQIDEMIRESVKMRNFNHPNVLCLIGVCIDGGPTPYIVTPFMANGSLQDYLKKNRTELILGEEADEDEVITTMKRLMEMCHQIAKGMEYLASKGFVHRDLATRNCMIDSNLLIKVADFGLSESTYSKTYFREEYRGVKLPVKWMAPESLTDGVFSEKTDVWSYGVTCWEVFSGGKTPYPGLYPASLTRMLEDGYRMEKPNNAACSADMYELMLSCWSKDPTERPTFSELAGSLSQKLCSMAGYMELSTISAFGTWEGNDPVTLPVSCESNDEKADSESRGDAERTPDLDVLASCNDESKPLTTPGVCMSATPTLGVGEEVVVSMEVLNDT